MAIVAIAAAATTVFSALSAAGGLFGGKDRSAKKKAGVARITAQAADKMVDDAEGWLAILDARLGSALNLDQINEATAAYQKKYPEWKEGQIVRLGSFYRSRAGGMPYANMIFALTGPIDNQADRVATAMAAERAAQIEAPRIAVEMAEAEIASADLLADRIAAAQSGESTGMPAVAIVAALAYFIATKKPKRKKRRR